ncbi:glycosyltransferase family 4 protein [Hyphomicrobium methylovorum]|uniref:glycosyltransferase family 4 protein n=1 Tax=Hyphomicrobium methylovorum TaxID=84 RepID=UPI0015E6C7AC|nr:glycosyltransferase family 4 protein [Hyphomicrobium methylovorum]
MNAFFRPVRQLVFRLRRMVLAVVPFLFFRLGLFRVWQKVPQRIRRRIVDIVTRGADERGSRPATAVGPFFVCGLASSSTSFGWALRGTLATLIAQQETARAVDISSYFWADYASNRLPQPELDTAKGPGTLVVHVNPDQLGYVLSILPSELVASKYIVQSLVWEFEHLPQAWLGPMAFADEFWVPSHFVRQAVERAGLEKPIRVVPHLLDVPQDLDTSRTRFGIPEDVFAVLCVFNIRSGLSRKNVAGVVAAFKAAFDDRPQARLILKCHDGHLDPAAFAVVQSYCGKNIAMIADDLSERDTWSLIGACDCLLSLHRSEGFGLVLKQALLLEKPVVATGWSGNLDFMTNESGQPEPNCYLVSYDLVPVGSNSGIHGVTERDVWAEARIKSAKAHLLEVYKEWESSAGLMCRADG